jgi:hypothetical protein
MSDLFSQLDEAKRAQLRRRKWHEAGGKLVGRMMWRSPEGDLYDESEAFKRLARLEAEEAARGQPDAPHAPETPGDRLDG